MLWTAKKNVQVWIRKELSHWLAIGLAFAVGYREHDEFVQLYYDVICHTMPSFFEIFIVLLLLGTIAAALWEIWGNKLSTSPQEKLFVRVIRSLLLEIEAMLFAGALSQEEAAKRFNNFVKGFLALTSSTVCAHKEVDGGLMLKALNRDVITRTHASDPSTLDVGLEVRIPANDFAEKNSGPGGISFRRAKLVYMPSVKKRKEAWPISWDDSSGRIEDYKLDGIPTEAWVTASSPQYENFASMLCAPVGRDQNGNTRYGVLEYTTTARDPFVDRDFMMVECFASILSQAAAITAQCIISSESNQEQQPPAGASAQQR
jgi:hypothetical protein